MAAQQRLGSGTYGTVVSPALQNTIDGVATNFPGNVTKVYYEQSAYDDAVSKIPLISTVMGENAGHRMNRYTKKYTGKNLKDKLHITNTDPLFYISNTDPLYILRMPNLGKDFSSVNTYVDIVRATPLMTIFEQILKLFNQTNTLKTSGYIHGDIRESNIMFNPRDGTMTIIDFDYLQPIDIFDDKYGENYGFYSNPPESIIIRNLLAIKKPSHIWKIKTEEWSEQQFRSFNNFYKATGVSDESKLRDDIKIINEENTKYIEEVAHMDPTDAAKRVMLPTFDSYGLAITLLEFLIVVYTPRVFADELSTRTIDQLRSELVSIGVTKRGVAYTAAELNTYAKALLSIVNTVLRPMALGYARNRIDIGEGLRRAQEIMTELQRDLAASTSAGGARRTHRSRRNRRNKPRRTARR